MGLDMGAFEQAWNLLKALPEQQAFSTYARAPKTMGDTNPASMGIERYGTVHPAIRGLLERRAGHGHRSGANLHVAKPNTLRNPFASYSNIESAPDRRFGVDEQKEEDEAQKRRGSMFSGNPDEFSVLEDRLTPAQINPTE
tara:strand:+ start:119 stop:541 length:423 start_codon:yes stop_codon:yes gene_type:complete